MLETTENTCPFSGQQFKILNVDGKTLIFQTPFKGNVAVEYDKVHDCYKIPANFFKPFKVITAKEASVMLDVSTMRISRLCVDRVLKSVKINNSLVIDETSVKDYKNARNTNKSNK